MDSISKIIKELPSQIEHDGAVFVFRISHSEVELKITYDLSYVHPESKHQKKWLKDGNWFNPFLKNLSCPYLYIYEKIEDVSDLEMGVNNCKRFLYKHKLHPKEI